MKEAVKYLITVHVLGGVCNEVTLQDRDGNDVPFVLDLVDYDNDPDAEPSGWGAFE